jgi:hypothetical protein
MAVTPFLWLFFHWMILLKCVQNQILHKKVNNEKVRKMIFSIFFEFLKVCKNFEMAVTPFLSEA